MCDSVGNEEAVGSYAKIQMLKYFADFVSII